jgi:hypothetical protein
MGILLGDTFGPAAGRTIQLSILKSTVISRRHVFVPSKGRIAAHGCFSRNHRQICLRCPL